MPLLRPHSDSCAPIHIEEVSSGILGIPCRRAAGLLSRCPLAHPRSFEASFVACRLAPKAERGSPCTWASGCCQRHPISCRDSSYLKIEEPNSCGNSTSGCCVGSPVYTRIGKTGSKNTTMFFASKGGCAQWQVRAMRSHANACVDSTSFCVA